MRIEELAKMPIFPFADEFPMIPDEEIMELAQDIEANGLVNPLIIFKDQILDGRNRIQALLKTNLKDAEVTYFDGTEFEAVEFVRTMNILRRHLTPSQRDMVALAYLPYEEQEAKRRQGQRTDLNIPHDHAESSEPIQESEGKRGEARNIVAEKFNTSGQRLSQAKKVALNAPDLADEVRAGTKTLDAANKELKARSEATERKEHALQVGASDLYQRYRKHELSLDEAYVALSNRQAEAARKRREESNEALELIMMFNQASEERLREFNIVMPKLVSVGQVDRALVELAAVQSKLEGTKTGLLELRQLRRQEQ